MAKRLLTEYKINVSPKVEVWEVEEILCPFPKPHYDICLSGRFEVMEFLDITGEYVTIVLNQF